MIRALVERLPVMTMLMHEYATVGRKLVDSGVRFGFRLVDSRVIVVDAVPSDASVVPIHGSSNS